VRVWEVVTKREVARLQHDGQVLGLAFSPDGAYLATGAGDNTARLWDSVSWEEKRRLTHGSYVVGVAFSPDGKSLATASRDHKVRLSQLSGEVLWENDHLGEPHAIAFDPKGRYVAVLCDDNVVWLLGARNGKAMAQLRHEGRVISMALGLDGDFVTTAGMDNTIRLWQPSDGREIMRFAHDGSSSSFGLDPSGKYLLIGGAEGVAQFLWRPSDLAAEACKRLRRKSLTPEEWRRFLPGQEYAETCPPTTGMPTPAH
jgi:WD40 repeat protein